MYLACSTMTDLIDRMEKNGLVVRVRDERYAGGTGPHAGAGKGIIRM